MKAARAREYEARWHANCAQDMSEDLFASGWKQPPMRADGFGGWEYASIHVEANSAALPQYPSWKRNLHPQHLDRRYGGWDQYPSSSSEDTALGGWLYSDPSDQLGDFQKEVEILGKKVYSNSYTCLLSSFICLVPATDELLWSIVLSFSRVFLAAANSTAM